MAAGDASAYRFTTEAIQRTGRQWMDAVQRDYNHPSVMAWVPCHESWGVPNLPEVAAERHDVETLYHLTHIFDLGLEDPPSDAT